MNVLFSGFHVICHKSYLMRVGHGMFNVYCMKRPRMDDKTGYGDVACDSD